MYNYNPYGYGQPVYQQGRPMQQQVQQPNMPFQDVRFVTAEEAKGFMVLPNSNALLIDRQNKIATLKMADGMGQSTTQLYKFEPLTEKPGVDLSVFAKKDEVVTIEQYNALVEQLASIQKMIGGNNG